MPSDTLVFSQGQTATFTAQFVTMTGMAIDVPDATVEIYGTGGAIILSAVSMVHVTTGFYFYDYPIPNSLPVNTYTVRITGTVLGVPSAITQYLEVVLAGTPTSATLTQKKVELIAALETYIKCSQHIPVMNEVARRMQQNTTYQLSFPRWNLTNAEIRLNNETIYDGYTLNYDTGTIVFSSPRHSTDRLTASYNFRWFTQEEELRFLSDALSEINNEPGGYNSMTLDNVDDRFVGILMMGAVRNAIKALMFCLQFQQPQMVFGGKEGAKDAFTNFTTLKDNNEKQFNEQKVKSKKFAYPGIKVVSTPEFTLPGGRSRWFRYLYSTGI